jgi:alpha-mannosidase
MPGRSRNRQALPADADEHYSIMAADHIVVTSPGPVLGEIVTRGRLVDRRARRLARFTQTTQVWRGSRVILLDIELAVDELPGPQPWNSYYAARFAWGDATMNLTRGVHMLSRPTDAVRLEAPYFIEMRSGNVRTSILTVGLPYHRRYGLRKLDSLLIVRGETARRFRLGIGIDIPYPMTAAMEMMVPQTKAFRKARPPHAGTGWLFHLDARNVLVTRWEPLFDQGQTVGYRAWLLETHGRRVEAALRSHRPVTAAHLIGEADNDRLDLPVAGDRCTIELGPHQWVQVEARFADAP